MKEYLEFYILIIDTEYKDYYMFTPVNTVSRY